jgi:hypothetical protein
MQRLVYISTARGAVSPALVVDILGKSRLNNQRDGLTGLLIVGGSRFFQLLEGPPALLERTYGRIKSDPRHFALVELERKPIAAISLPNWEMAYMEAGGASGDTLAQMVGRLTGGITDLGLQAHLRGFADFHSRAA